MSETGPPKLTDKQQAFADEYLICWNATESYMRVYSPKNRGVAAVNGSRLLRNAKISAHIKQRIDEKAMTADELLIRVAEHARGDLSKYIMPSGELDLESLKADGLGHILKKHRVFRTRTTRKDGSEYETETIESELYPADSAHDRLMRYHGLYNDKIRVEDWQSDIVELLRTGRLSPEDVKAAYPDLAADFFAKAGVNASSND